MGDKGEKGGSSSSMNIQVDSYKIPIKLNDRNWLQWSAFVRHSLQRKLQYEHLTKEPPKNITAEWQAIDSDIMMTLLSAMEPDIQNTAITCDSAKALWDHLTAVYSGTTSMAHAYSISQGYSRCSQGDRSLSEYYTHFKSLVDQLEECFPLTTDLQKLRERHNKLHVLTFIGGLSSAHDLHRPMILGHSGATDLQSTYHLLREMFASPQQPTSTHENSSALASYGRGTGRGFRRGGGRTGRGTGRGFGDNTVRGTGFGRGSGRDMSQMECYYCHEMGHTKMFCPKLQAKGN